MLARASIDPVRTGCYAHSRFTMISPPGVPNGCQVATSWGAIYHRDQEARLRERTLRRMLTAKAWFKVGLFSLTV